VRSARSALCAVLSLPLTLGLLHVVLSTSVQPFNVKDEPRVTNRQPERNTVMRAGSAYRRYNAIRYTAGIRHYYEYYIESVMLCALPPKCIFTLQLNIAVPQITGTLSASPAPLCSHRILMEAPRLGA